MNAREKILKRVRDATDAIPEKSPLPSIDDVKAFRSNLAPSSDDLDTVVEAFGKRWKESSGVLLEGLEDLREFIKLQQCVSGYIDPALVDVVGDIGIEMTTRYSRDKVDDIQLGITRASFAIAETGTIALRDADTPNRLAALAPWVHVAVLRKESIEPTLAQSVARFDADPSLVLVTGPSKTADIEGILIEGVHGPGKQAVLLI